MLKKKFGLFLGLVVLAGSACVTPTHASSAPPIVISHIQTGSPTSPLSEFIAVHNNTSTEVDITGWCLINKAMVQFACFDHVGQGSRYVLPAYSSATIASTDFADEKGLSLEYFTVTYTVTNRSSGSIVSGSDAISLIDYDYNFIDSYVWSISPGTGNLFQRLAITSSPLTYAITGTTGDWSVIQSDHLPVSQAVIHLPQPEDPTEPDPDTDPGPGPGSEPEVPTIIDPFITELLPNPEGSDTGNEYIEIYNPNDSELLLDAYALIVGVDLEKSYSFPAGVRLPAGGYAAFSNSDIKFTLLNSDSKVQLSKEGLPIGDVISYTSPESGMAWAYIGEAWQYTDTPTPNAANVLIKNYGKNNEEKASSTTGGMGTEDGLKPCAPNQYRHPETNRCRLIETASSSSSLVPCKAGQERNPATNRCVNVAVAKELAPCKEGQERNPDTNRCVNIKKMVSADYGVKGESVQAGENGINWYLWLAIAGIVVSVVGYGLWEWRQELQVWLKQLGERFARRPK